MSNFKVGVAKKVRGAAECKNCHKPCCIHSTMSVSNMRPPLSPSVNDERVEDPHIIQSVKRYQAMAKTRLNDAMVSPIYMCGMASLLDPMIPINDVFLDDPSLD